MTQQWNNYRRYGTRFARSFKGPSVGTASSGETSMADSMTNDGDGGNTSDQPRVQIPTEKTDPVADGGIDSLDLDRIIPPGVRERCIEETRQADSMRGIILETITILYREYNVRGLKYFRLRVADAVTSDELKVASDMLLTLGRFHEVFGRNDGP